jgi:hypothetical protein
MTSTPMFRIVPLPRLIHLGFKHGRVNRDPALTCRHGTGAVKCGGWDKVLSCQVPRAWSFLRAKQGLILWGYIEGLPDCRCKPGAPPECHKVNQPDPKAVDDLKKFMVVVGIGTGVALAPEMEPLLVPETSLVPLCDCAMTRRLRIKL